MLSDAESDHDAFLWSATPSLSPDSRHVIFTRDFDFWLHELATEPPMRAMTTWATGRQLGQMGL